MAWGIPKGERQQRWLVLAGILVLAAGLRLWGLLLAAPLWHPDEHRLVFWPLGFLGGDLNPHFFNYPTLQFYLCALVYAGYYLVHGALANGWTLTQFAAYHYFWDADALLLLARLLGVGMAVGTVAWAYLLGRQLGGETPGRVAALLVAVSAVHVRQSPLAAVDVPMTLWYVGVTWAAVRLLRRESPRDYLLAGALVGLATATKYPGALAGVGVLAAHLLARRAVLDRRLWLAAAASVGAFTLASPYVLLDFDAFRRDFSFEAQHLQQGRADVGSGWGYYLAVSLRYGLGWIGTGLAAAAAILALRRRRPEVLVVAASLLSYLGVMGAGRLVFVRYALPMVSLACVLAADGVGRVGQRRWRLGLAAVVCMQPLYGAVRVAQLQASEDTRVEARDWIVAHVPPGTAIGNFGGWAGDVPLLETEGFWWRVKYFERAFGREAVVGSLGFLESRAPGLPSYDDVVSSANRQQENGDLKLAHERKCGYVVLHRHPLDYSRVDSSFATELAATAELVAHWAPAGLASSDPQYDPNDAYYIPVGRFGELRQPGPEIEVWRLPRYAPPPRAVQTTRELFAGAYDTWAGVEGQDGRSDNARALAQQAIEIDSTCVEALCRLGAICYLSNELPQAKGFLLRAAARQPRHDGVLNNLGLVYQKSGDLEEALRCFRSALAIVAADSQWTGDEQAKRYESRVAETLVSSAEARLSAGDSAAARDRLRQILALRGDQAPPFMQAARLLFRLGDVEGSTRAYRQALVHDPGNPAVCTNLGWNLYLQGRLDEASELCSLALAKGPNSVAAFNLGLLQVAQGDEARARAQYARAVAQFGADEARRIGAVADLSRLAAHGPHADLARSVLRTHWPDPSR